MNRHLKRLGIAVGAGVVLLLGSACGGAVQPGAQPVPTSATPAPQAPGGQPAPRPPDGATAVPAAQLDYSKLPKDYPHSVWVTGNGTTLGAVAQEGGCGRASAEVSSQTAEQVVLTLVETQPATPRPCTMDLRYPKVTAQLSAPLGNRKVVVQRVSRKV